MHLQTWMWGTLLASVVVHLAHSAWTFVGTRSVTKRLIASAQAHEAAEREHQEAIARLNKILEESCPKCHLLAASLSAVQQRLGAQRS